MTCKQLLHGLVAVVSMSSAAMSPMHAQATERSAVSTVVQERESDVAIRQALTTLLAAYARKDLAGMMALVDSGGVTVFGTDSAEVVRGARAFEQLMRSDFAQWDSSSFETPRNVSIARSGTLATAFFEVGWTAYRGGGSGRYLLRFATTWMRGADRNWRLRQSMNAVATTGR
jgi:ketosteroid isomerase-like protein